MQTTNKHRALIDHLNDRKQQFKKGEYEADCYFSSYLLTHKEFLGFEFASGRYSNLAENQDLLRCEVRVGDYEFDGCGSFVTDDVSKEDDYISMRNLLWELTPQAFRVAQVDFLENCERTVDSNVARSASRFSKVEPIWFKNKYYDLPELDMDELKETVRSASKKFDTHPKIADSSISFCIEKLVRHYANSEGTSFNESGKFYKLAIGASMHAKDGELLELFQSCVSKDVHSCESMMKNLDFYVSEMISDLLEMADAPVQKPGSFPLLLDAYSAGVSLHEVVGHRLEGERQNSEVEGDTFEGKIGQIVAPEFLTLIDDPTLKEFKDSSNVIHYLTGHYDIDDEGVPASKVMLIENGELKNYLLSRVPVNGYSEKLNGHGRTDGVENIIARMSNLIAYSNNPFSQEELNEMAILEASKASKEYCIKFEDFMGGYTGTSADFLRITPQKSYRIWAEDSLDEDTGRYFKKGDLQLVRGIEACGTPLILFRNMLAMGDDYAVGPGNCGAESGSVKVCSISPSILLSNIQIVSKAKGALENPFPKPSAYLLEKKEE